MCMGKRGDKYRLIKYRHVPLGHPVLEVRKISIGTNIPCICGIWASPPQPHSWWLCLWEGVEEADSHAIWHVWHWLSMKFIDVIQNKSLAHIKYKQDYFGIPQGQTSKNDLQYFRWKRHLVHLSSFTIMQRYLLRFVHPVYINDICAYIYTETPRADSGFAWPCQQGALS